MGRGGSRYGAGRPGWRPKAESCLRLDVRELSRRHILGRIVSTSWRWTNSHTGEEVGSIGIRGSETCLQLNYSTNGTPVSETIEIARSACIYGGSRPWLRCPPCNRRAGVLYMRGGRFTCRKCSGVAYTSQSEDAIGRTWRAQQKLEALLGKNWARPKGMHNTTCHRIMKRILGFEELRETELAAHLLRLGLTL